MLSEHAQKRMMQRGRIPKGAIDLILNYGEEVHSGGVKKYIFRKKAVDELTKGIKKILQVLPKLKDVAVIVGRNNQVVTVYRTS